MNVIKKNLKRLLSSLKPLVWRIAEFYDLQINRPYYPYGPNKIFIEDDEAKRIHNIPKTVYFNTGSGDIYVGANTQFGERVQLLTGMHIHAVDAKKQGFPAQTVPKNGRDIVIGKNCYIGGHAVIIGPVKLGDGAVVGAGAVVTKDVPKNAFVTGMPATIKKYFN